MDLTTQDKITIGSLAASVGVTAIMLTVTVCLFVRYRRNEKKKLEEEKEIKERRGLQWRSREVPYRLGEDVIPSTYPDYPDYRDYPVDYPIDVVEEYPVDYFVDCPEPRARFFPVDETPYPMRPCIEPPVVCDCEPEPQPEQRVIFEPAAPQPPPEPKIVVYQPLPRDPTPPPPPPPPQREIIREIYFPSQPQPPPPPRERRGSWCGPSNDDWVLVKKEVKRTKPKKVTKRVEDSDDESVSSSSSDEEEAVSPYNRRLMPYDLAMPRIQFPQPPTLMPVQPIYLVPRQPALVPAPVIFQTPTLAPAWKLMPYDLAMPRMQFPQPQMQMPQMQMPQMQMPQMQMPQMPPIYFIPQQPAPAPAPAPVPAPAPCPAPVPAPVPAPAPRNAFFAANVRRFDNRQYEEQEQRTNVATENYNCDNDCSF